MILEKKDIDAIIFDLDGTLMDSMGVWREIDVEFLSRFGMSVPDDLLKNIEGMSFSETAVYFRDVLGIPLTVEEISDCWNEMAMYKYSHEVKPKPGAKEFVLCAKDLGIPMAIASSNSVPLIEAVLKRNGLEDCIDAVAISCEVPKGKPAPDVYLLAAKRVNADPSRCVVFEDILPGIIGGKAAGMRVIVMDDQHSVQSREEKESLAEGYIVSFDEIELR